MNQLGVTLIAIFCSFFLSHLSMAMAAKGEIPERVVRQARIEIWKVLSQDNASSAAVAIMAEGKVVYAERFGMRSREETLPADSTTQYNIGSVSKIFTAAAVLTLVDQGKVELDRPVRDYLEDFFPDDELYRKITVRMLLNHSSGLPGTNFYNGFGARRNPDYVVQTLSYLKSNGLKHQPGQISVYCNDGFTVAQALIERVSGMSYAAYLQKTFFTPLAMDRSSCFFLEGDENIAHVYQENGSPLPPEYVSALATGGISSTAEDLCRFSTVVFDANLLSPKSLAEFTEPQFAPDTAVGEKPLLPFGLGWDCLLYTSPSPRD